MVIAAALLALLGLVLIADLVWVWSGDRSAMAGAERAQLLIAVALAAFVATFFVSRAGSSGDSTTPVAAAPGVAGPPEQGTVAQLAVAARLPSLQQPAEKPAGAAPAHNQHKPSQAETPAATPATVEPPVTESTTTTTTAPPTTTTPAPSPAPAPPPEPPVSFDDSG